MGPVIGPATVKDFLDYAGELPQHRVIAWAARLEGRVIGLGGVMLLPGGGCLAFVDVTDEARRFHKTLHATGLRFMRHIRSMNLGPIYATADLSLSRTEEWLERLGFSKHEAGGSRVFIDGGSPSHSNRPECGRDAGFGGGDHRGG